MSFNTSAINHFFLIGIYALLTTTLFATGYISITLRWLDYPENYTPTLNQDILEVSFLLAMFIFPAVLMLVITVKKILKSFII
jgi:hypothetical protein